MTRQEYEQCGIFFMITSTSVVGVLIFRRGISMKISYCRPYFLTGILILLSFSVSAPAQIPCWPALRRWDGTVGIILLVK